MSITVPISKSSILNPQSSVAQPDFSQTLIAQNKVAAGATKAQVVKPTPAKKPVFYQSGDVIYKLGKYRITAAPTGYSHRLDIYVNGFKRSIEVDTTKGKLLVGQTIARMVKDGEFKDYALSWGEQADGSLTKISNERVYISAFNSPVGTHLLQPIIQPFQGKAMFADVDNNTKLVERLGYAAAARGKSFSEITINCHGLHDGKLYMGDEVLHASELIKKLIESGSIKKGGTIEFDSCLVGQDFDGMRDAAKKYGINIKAANYFTNGFGVTGSNTPISKLGGLVAKSRFPEENIPLRPDVLSFTPSGKVFGSDGKEIFKIEYEKK